ncbi:hypothetical protein OC834_003486 [Tilletia horrida]|nr:hypothetical protein OC834_003486 [Tilletia horrida]
MLFRSLATALLASSAFAATVVFDCTKVPNICSNDCYAIQCAGKPTLLHRDSNDATYHRGGTLSSFYTNNGVTEGKAYNVGFSNSGGLQYCGTGCSNTGNEVIRRGEQGQRPGPQFLRRHFRSNEGHSILMFERWSEPGSLDHLVGSQVWLAHEERNVTITHAA